MKRGFSNFIALDIGSSKILGAAAHINKQGEAIINSQVLQHSEGLKSGIITNMELAENTIISAIYSLEKDCEKSIKETAISLPGSGVKSYYVNYSIKLGNQHITNSDVKKLINKALAEFKVKDQEIIHYFPIEFKVNNNQVVENPVGLYAKELSCHVHIIAADSMMITNLIKCFAKCHVEVSEIITAIYASGLATLSEDEMTLGSIIIDMGASTTSYAIFLDGKIVYVNHVPLGGSNITLDIAKAFFISIKEAEKIKILYGNANLSLLLNDSVIKLEGDEKTITSTELINVVSPRVKEILTKIKQQCDSMYMDHLLARQIVITGGGSLLPGIKSLVAETFQKQVRIAKPLTITGLVESYNPYTQSTIIGMIQSKLLIFQKNAFKSERYQGAGWFKKTFLWLKENI